MKSKLKYIGILLLLVVCTTGGLASSYQTIYDATITSTTTGTAYRLTSNGSKYTSFGAVLIATNNAGTNPTASVEVQVSPDCVHYGTIHTFTGLTTGSDFQAEELSDATNVAYACWRVKTTIGGTNSPSYSIKVQLFHD